MNENLILVTGNNGFVGSCLCERLKLMNLPFYGVSRTNGFNLADESCIKNIPRCNIVMHLASLVPQKNTGDNYEKDIDAMKNLISYCKRYNAKVIFNSSCAVYGKPENNPVTENERLEPAGKYGESKKVCEYMLIHSGVEGFILRFFNIYGPGQSSKFLIPILIEKIKKRGVVKLMPGAKRDFVYVDDAVDALLRSLADVKDNQGIKIINIGSGRSTKIKDIAVKISGILNAPLLTDESGLAPQNQVEEIYAEGSRAKNILRWEPTVALNDGLKKTVCAT